MVFGTHNMLWHSSITVTSDIYTSVLPQVAFAAAEATAAIIPRQSARSLGLPSGSQPTIKDGGKVEEQLPEIAKPQVEEIFNLGSEGAPSGTRTRTRWLRASDTACQTVSSDVGQDLFLWSWGSAVSGCVGWCRRVRDLSGSSRARACRILSRYSCRSIAVRGAGVGAGGLRC
jgi:hypothetical protein